MKSVFVHVEKNETNTTGLPLYIVEVGCRKGFVEINRRCRQEVYFSEYK